MSRLAERCPESGNALYGHWRRGDTLLCDYCERTVAAQNSGGCWRVPRHNTKAMANRTKLSTCSMVGAPPGITWRGPLGTVRTQCYCGRNVAVNDGLIANHRTETRTETETAEIDG